MVMLHQISQVADAHECDMMMMTVVSEDVEVLWRDD